MNDNELMLRYIEASSSLHERLLEQNRNYAAQEKMAKDKRGGVIEKMLSVSAIHPHQKAAAEAMLSNPAQALDILCNALDKMAEFKQAVKQANAELGQPVASPAGRAEPVAQQKSAGVAYLGLSGRTSSEAASIMASIMSDPN